MKPPVIREDAIREDAIREDAIREDAPPALPKALGRFRIESMLGGGSFGTVYRAFDPLVGEHVALKVLRPELSKNTEQMERLRREVVLARKVDHPGVCRIHDLHQDGEALFVVMELIDGETLDLVYARGPLAPARATRVIEDVCRALAAAHDVGVLHRDIKPSNVMIRVRASKVTPGTRDDEVTLVDFGIATTQGLEHLTRPGVALGTVGYLAPELWEGDDASPASDVFAAGVLLYGSLTLKMPWRATGMALAQQMRSVKPVPPSMYAPPPTDHAHADQAHADQARKIDARLDAIVLKALALEPDDRYASARAFADALHAWRAGVDDALGPTSPPRDGDVLEARDTTPVPTAHRTTSRAPLIGTSIGIAMSLAILFVATRDPPSPPQESPALAPVVERAPLELTRPDVPPLVNDDTVEFVPATPGAPEARERPDRPRPTIASGSNELTTKMVNARSELTRAMKERELVTGDVPSADSALRSRLGGARAVTNLEAALVDVKAASIDRAFVERKLARLQARAAGRGPDTELDNLAAGIAADIGARKYVEANRRLNRALALTGRFP